MKDRLLNIQRTVENSSSFSFEDCRPVFEKLKEYYRHQYQLLQSFEKDPGRLKTNSGIIAGWMDEIQKILDAAP
ncbi:hypothetical protein SDC9_207162 [bioreactor metagenome]|uniref:Uncharacterized protein n=1 Tax=bioreactor metagenome TaxID=1076179 RepID=A0A645J748_9ZZZZ